MYKSYKIIIYRLIQATNGLLVLYLISTNLNSIEQGYFYALGSIISLIWIFDLGMSQIAVNILSKNFIGLSWKGNKLLGNNSLFFVKLKAIFNFYFISSVFFVFLSPLFFIYIRVDDYYSFNYIFLISIFLSLLVGVNFCLLPLLFFLDSSKKISYAYDLRIFSNITAIILYIIFFKNNFSVLSIISSQLALFFVNLFIIFSFRVEILNILKINLGNLKHEKKLLFDSFPSYLSGFVINVLSIPFVHNIFGPEISGKYGMSLIILNLIALLGLSHYQYNVPKMTRLFGSKNKKKDAKILFRKTVSSFIFIFLFSLVFLYFFIDNFFEISKRLLTIDNFLKLALFVLISNLCFFYNFFTRLFLKDYFKKNNYYFLLLTLIIFVFIFNIRNFSLYLHFIIFASLILLFSNFLVFKKYK